MTQTISSSQRHSFSLRCFFAIPLLIAMIAFVQPMQAQRGTYGISAVTTVNAPYPITLDGFVAEGGTKIALQILPTDVTIAQYPVLLKLVISGNGITLDSKTLYIHEPVYLNGNEVTMLDGNDLQAFFNPDNLNFNGYSKTQYQRNGRLPEGVYTVGFELYDVLRKIQVASVKSTLVFLFLNEVPALTLPLSGDLISAAGTQVVNFRWSTRHSPMAATFFTPQYLFELWDIQPESMNPYEIVRGTRPVYATTVSSTYLSYGIAEPPLLPGHTYAWRVRESDPDGKTLFKNDGYTEVYTFKYGINCPAPELKADKAGTSNLSVLWQANPNENNFELRYRDKKKKNPEWYTQSVNTLSSKVENLKSNTVYEIEVCAICGDQRSEYSNRVEMNTRQNTSFKCGQIDSSKLPQNQNPLRKLSSGDVFKAFGFDVEVKEASGSGGTFTGKGYVLVPLLNFIKIEAKFDNARINEDYQLIGGEVKTVYNLKNSLTYIPGQGVAGLSDLTDLAKLIAGDKEKNQFDDLANKKIEVDSVKEIKIEDNKIIVTDANGKKEEVPLTAGKVVSIKTDEGNEYVVDGNGTIYSSGNSGQKTTAGNPSGPVTTAALVGKGSPKYNVSFIPHKLQECGFDYPTDKSPKDNYEQVSLTENPILVPWKSLEAGHIERTVAEIAGGPADSVRYYRQSNNVVMTAPGEKATQKQIMLNGNGKNDEDKLFAWYAAYTQSDSGKTYARVLAGQLNLISYEKKAIKVVLVPVNNASCPNPDYVKTELNKIYKSAVVEWDVAPGNNLTVTFSGTVFDNTDPNDRMDYTDDMKAVISALKEDPQYNRETYYLFFLDNAKDLNTKGYMPLKQQFGFIFKYKQYPDEYLRTIAHELGHGPFRLWHTFSNSNKYIQPQGTTDNLMDYANASALKLNKYQWDWMHDPEWRLYWFEKESEAEIKGIDYKCIPSYISKKGTEEKYFTNTGQPVLLNKNYEPIAFVGTGDVQDGGYNDKIGGLAVIKRLSDGALMFPAKSYTKYPHYYKAQTDGTIDVTDFIRDFVDVPAEQALLVLIDKDCNYSIKKNDVELEKGSIKTGCNCIKKSNENNLSGESFSFLPSTPLEKIDPTGLEIPEKLKWINSMLTADGMPILTTNLSDIKGNENIISFTFNKISYIGIAAKTTAEYPAFFGYVEEVYFNNLIKTNKEVKVSDIDLSKIFNIKNFIVTPTGKYIYKIKFDTYLQCYHIFVVKHDGRFSYSESEYAKKIIRFLEGTCDDLTILLRVFQIVAQETKQDLNEISALMIQMLEDVTEAAKIPRKYYDPSLKGAYNPILYNTFKSLSLSSAIGVFNSPDETFAQLQFAYNCGIYNGVLDQAKGILEAVPLITQILTNDNTRKGIWTALTNLSAKGIIDKIGKDFSGTDFQKSEMAGEYTVGIVTVVIPLSKVNWISKAESAINLIKNLPKIALSLKNELQIKVIAKLFFDGDTKLALYYKELNNNIKLAEFEGEKLIIIGQTRNQTSKASTIFRSEVPVNALENGVNKYGFYEVYKEVGEDGTETLGVRIIKAVDEGLLEELKKLSTIDEIEIFVKNNLERIKTCKATIWEVPEAPRGKIVEAIWNNTEYASYKNLNEFRKNFPTLDFADDVVEDGLEVISMKSYHPLDAANRTIDNFTKSIKGNLNSLAEADLKDLTEIIKKKNGNMNLVDRNKILTVVVKEGQWDVNELQKIADELIKEDKYVKGRITQVIIKTF